MIYARRVERSRRPKSQLHFIALNLMKHSVFRTVCRDKTIEHGPESPVAVFGRFPVRSWEGIQVHGEVCVSGRRINETEAIYERDCVRSDVI